MAAMWPLFIGLHVIGLTGYNLLLRSNKLQHFDRWTIATIMQTGITAPLIFIMPLWPAELTKFSLESWLLVAIVVPLVIALHLTNVKALQYLEASVYSVLFNLRILITTLIGLIFVHEAIIPWQLVGGLLIFLAIVTVRQKGNRTIAHRGITWGIAAAVAISALNFFERELIMHVGFIAYAPITMVLATMIMWAVLLGRKQSLPLRTFGEPQILALIVFRTISAYGFTLAFYYGAKLSVASYISSLSVIFIVMLGVIVLKERDYLRQKLIATSLAVVGLTCILISNM
jgi:drug/metabolite transporter (DMT)-like permease